MPGRSLLVRSAVATIRLDMSGTNITTSAYATVSSSVPASCAGFEVFNPSGSTIKLAVGGAGSEVDIPYTVLPGGSSILIPFEIAKGKRLSAKAIDANTTSGIFVVNLFG